jgi:HEAT repeat protein
MAQLRLRTRLALSIAGPRQPTVDTVGWLAANPSRTNTRALCRILADPLLPWIVRQAAARALGELAPPAGTAELAEIARMSREFELCEEATLALAKRGDMLAVPGCLRLVDALITDYIGRTESDEQNLETISEHRVAEALDLLGASAVETILDPTIFRDRMPHLARHRTPLQRPDEARIVALLRIGPTAKPPVVAAVSSSAPRTASCAATVAARVAGDSAIPALVDALAHASKDVRVGATGSLRYLRAAALRPHVAGLLRDPSEDVREEAARAVVDLKVEEVAPLLVDLLSDRSSRTRALSVDALSKLKAPGLGPLLPELIADKDERVRDLAVAAAGSVRSREAISALISLANMRHGYSVARAATEALGDIGDPAAVQPLRELLGDTVLSREAGIALAKLGPAGEAALLESADSGDPARSRAAVDGLLRVDTKAALDRILRATADAGAEVRLREWVGLTTPIRLDLLSDPRAHVRAAAARISEAHLADPPEVLAKLRELAESDPDVRVRARALYALPGTDDDAVALRLVELGNPEPEMRDACAAMLGIYEPPGALDALRTQLERETVPELKETLAQYVSRLERSQPAGDAGAG